MTLHQTQAENSGLTINHALARAVGLINTAGVNVKLNLYDEDGADAVVTGKATQVIKFKIETPATPRGYAGKINFADSSENGCHCGFGMPTHDSGQKTKLCTHATAALIVADGGQFLPIPESAPRQAGERKPRQPKVNADGSVSAPATTSQSFKAKMSRKIRAAIEAIVEKLQEVHEAGRHPIMVGPTGCGKTSAADLLAEFDTFQAYEALTGIQEIGAADMVGLITPGRDVPGVFARGFARALEGETVLFFFDEWMRFNPLAQEICMKAILPTSAAAARKMGFETDEPVYYTEAPAWGRIYAPCSKVKYVFGGNPWGARPDAAFVNRVKVLQIDYSYDVLKLLDDELAAFVAQTWQFNKDGVLDLPVTYRELSRLKNGSDRSWLDEYMQNLEFYNPGQAEIVRAFLPAPVATAAQVAQSEAQAA